MKYSRKEIWQHNGFLGTCAFARKGLLAIHKSRTATKEAMIQAAIVEGEIIKLEKLLKVKANAN